VLPHIVAEQHALAVHQRRVLVGVGDQRQLAGAVDKYHRPAGPELASAGLVEALLEMRERPEIACEGGSERPVRLPAFAAHDRPEHAVVGVSAAVVANHRPYPLRQFAKKLGIPLFDFRKGGGA
jgi:hypothetical protein